MTASADTVRHQRRGAFNELPKSYYVAPPQVSGSAPIRLAARELGSALDAPHEATVSGLLIERLGRVSAKGETVELEGIALEVLDSDETRVEEVAVAPAQPGPPSPIQ